MHRNRRAKIAKPLRVRPSEPRDEHFEDLPVSVNASKDGIYFLTRRSNYYKGMRVFVTYPYASDPGSLNQEFLGTVTRVDKLPGNKQGVAVQLLMPIYVGTKDTIR